MNPRETVKPLIHSAFVAVIASVTFSCTIESAPPPRGPVAPAPHTAPQPEQPAGTETASTTTPADPPESTPPAADYPPASEECPTPANHCLPDDEKLFWTLDKKWEQGWRYAEVATQKTPPDGAGVATFFLKSSGKERKTSHFYATTPAAPDQLAVGQRVMMFHGHRDDDIYQPPKTRADALGKRWWTARIAAVAPVSQGYVLVSGGYKIATSNLRLLDGDESETTAVAGSEDEQFLKSGHWMVSMKPLKDGGWQYVELAAPITEPSPQTKNEGHFIMVASGKQGWTGHAWRTRPATKDDLKSGARVFMFHGNRKDNVYHGPRDRHEAISKRWWTGVITDASSAYKGVATVSGKYQIALDGMRVPL